MQCNRILSFDDKDSKLRDKDDNKPSRGRDEFAVRNVIK